MVAEFAVPEGAALIVNVLIVRGGKLTMNVSSKIFEEIDGKDPLRSITGLS